MSTQVPSKIQIKNNPTLAVVDGALVVGANIAVANHTVRDAIDASVRVAGMLVYTGNDSTTWKLGTDLTTWTAVATPTSIVESNGTAVSTGRSKLNFLTGFSVADDSGNGSADVTLEIPVERGGTLTSTRPTLNFLTGFAIADNPGNTSVDITGLIEVEQSGELIGARQYLNVTYGLIATDNPGNNSVDIAFDTSVPSAVTVETNGAVIGTQGTVNFTGPIVQTGTVAGGIISVPFVVTADPEVTLPAFAISLVHLTPALIEVGASTPGTNLFEASRNYLATGSVLLTNTANAESLGVSTAFNGGTTPPTNPPAQALSASFTSALAPYTESTYGASITFTLTAVRNTILTRVGTATFTWTQIVHIDVGTVPGAYNSAFVGSLAGNLQTTELGTYTVNPGAGQYIFFAFRSAYGTPSFTIGGFSGGMSLVAAGVSVINAHGFTENFDIWKSDTANLGLTTVVVS
jgi:hypothetical protein